MRSINSKLLLSIALYVLSNCSFARMGEAEWNFKKDEVVNYNLTDSDGPVPHQGLENGCTQFSPSEVSFTLKYHFEKTEDAKIAQVRAIADAPNKVTHDRASQTITVIGAKTLDFILPFGTKYEITNITGVEVTGTDCQGGQD